MTRVVLRRLAAALPLLLGITLLAFLLMWLAPGDYFSALEKNPKVSQETIARLRAEFGLDRPWYVQYGLWLRNLARGNFGLSIVYRAPVLDLILPRVANTLALALSSMLLAWALAVPLGVWGAMRSGTALERAAAVLFFAALAVPGFFLAFLAVGIAAATGWLPVGGAGGAGATPAAAVLDYLRHLALPAGILAVRSVASLQRILRANLLDELGKDYVRSARAKGLSEAAAVWRHALPNAVNPLVTVLGYEVAGLLSGAALIEIVTAWPGLGRLLLDATLAQDVYLVMASLVMGSVLLVVGNLAADLLLAWSDPRVRVRA